MDTHPIALALVDSLVIEDGVTCFDAGVLAAVERDLATPHDDTEALFVALVELLAVVHDAGYTNARDALLAMLRRAEKQPHLAGRGGRVVVDGIEGGGAAPWQATPRAVGQGPKTGLSLVALRAAGSRPATAKPAPAARRSR